MIVHVDAATEQSSWISARGRPGSPATVASPDADWIWKIPGGCIPVCFGVVVPAHNEELLLPAALAALDRAIDHVAGVPVVFGVAVVLDACSDRSRDLVTSWQKDPNRTWCGSIEIVETFIGNVGEARRIGVETLLRRWADTSTEHIWLATTDADSKVPADWIISQLAVRSEGGQVWAGAVSVDDWSGRETGTAERWLEQYDAECLPIHGANFGIDAALYVEAGGFNRLSTGEDRDLFERTVALGAVVAHDPTVRVVTSSRRVARAPRGFAHALSRLEGLDPPAPEAFGTAAARSNTGPVDEETG